MSGESDQSGLQGPTGDGRVETRFLVYVAGEYFEPVRECLASINDGLADMGTDVRVGVGVPIQICTVTGSRKPTEEEKTKMADIIENALRARLIRSGKNWPITVKPEAGVPA